MTDCEATNTHYEADYDTCDEDRTTIYYIPIHRLSSWQGADQPLGWYLPLDVCSGHLECYGNDPSDDVILPNDEEYTTLEAE